MAVEFGLEWARGCAVSTVFEKIGTHFVPPTSVQQNKTNPKFYDLSSKYERGFLFSGHPHRIKLSENTQKHRGMRWEGHGVDL